MNRASPFSRPSSTSARLVAEFYALLGVAWVLVSHHLEEHRSGGAHGRAHAHLAQVNQLLFIAGSTLALYLVLRACHRRIADAHRAELAVASRYRALLDTSPDAIHLIDADGRLVEANHAFYRALGHDPHRPPPLNIADWDARWTPAKLRAKLLSLDHGEVFETLHRRQGGALVEVEISATGIDLDGRRLLLCVARDLTGRRQLERSQLRAERLESLGLLAGGVAHDLNNALSPVILGTELLRARHPGSADDPLLVSMSTAAKRGAGIIRQLLTFARGVEGERILVPVRPLLAGLAHLAEQNLPAGLRVELSFAPDLPPVRGDTAQLHQVLLSLMLNARDAMPQGGRLAIGARPRTLDATEAARFPGVPPGAYLEISVRDTGPGLSAEAREHLFEPFFTTKPRGQGTGLGLSTALGIVRSHGGTMEHVVPPEGGAELRVLLPVAAESEHPTAPAAHADRPPPPPQAAPSPRAPLADDDGPPGPSADGHDTALLDALIVGADRLVLVVDDDPAVRAPTRLLLERHGFRVLEADDGETALAQLAAGPLPALVLTDLMMTRLAGDALARRVRARHPALPVVAMTGLHADDPRAPDLRPLLSSGILAGLLVKPFNEAQLLAALARALEPERK